MNWHLLRVSHSMVRIVATITLADLGMMVGLDVWYPERSHALANTWVGSVLIYWTMAASLLLPLYVGLEGWWMLSSKVAFKALWIDAALATACFLLCIGFILFAFHHYVMF